MLANQTSIGVVVSGDNMTNIYNRTKQPLEVVPTVVAPAPPFFGSVNNIR